MRFIDHFGLDIGSTSIKLVQLTKNDGKYNLLTLGQIPTPVTIDPTQKDVNTKVLSEAIKKLAKDCRVSTKAVSVSLPESQVYTRVVDLPVMSADELGAALKFQIEQYVPLPASEISVKHTVITSQNPASGQMSVLLVACPNYLIDRYVQIVADAGLELQAIDTESLSSARALVPAGSDTPTTMIFDIGSLGSSFSLVKNGEIISTRSINTGGKAISRAISTELGIEEKQADEYRNSYGLKPDQLSGSVAKAMLPVVNLIVDEIKRVVVTIQNKNEADLPKRLVIYGGCALIPGLVAHLAGQLSLEVQLGNPFSTITRTQEQISAIGDSGAVFSNAVGLAMKEV